MILILIVSVISKKTVVSLAKYLTPRLANIQEENQILCFYGSPDF